MKIVVLLSKWGKAGRVEGGRGRGDWILPRQYITSIWATSLKNLAGKKSTWESLNLQQGELSPHRGPRVVLYRALQASFRCPTTTKKQIKTQRKETYMPNIAIIYNVQRSCFIICAEMFESSFFQKGINMVVIWGRFVLNVIFGFSKIFKLSNILFSWFCRKKLSPMNISRPPLSLIACITRLSLPFQTWSFPASLGLRYALNNKILEIDVTYTIGSLLFLVFNVSHSSR